MRGVALTLPRYLIRLYVQYFLAIYLAVLVVFLIADFGDRMKAYVAHRWLDVALLYWNKLLVAAQQLGPAAMLLGGSAAVSTLRKRGELTAMRALSFSPPALYLPVGLCALIAAALLVGFDEVVSTRASARVDDITVNRLQSWGDWRFHHTPTRWFRKGDRIFHLRGGDWERGFEDVTILTLSPDFGLARRIDAESMVHLDGTQWELEGFAQRDFFPGGSSPVEQGERRILDLGVRRSAFHIRPGRPEQMRVPELREQIATRAAMGLPTARFALALHNRFAYPLTGFAAAMLAVGLALRPGRKGHLTVALFEGLVVAVALWGLMVVGKALVLGGHLAAQAAAWAPFALLMLAAVVLWLRREGRLGRSGI
ncbi:MAG: LptF/LptG family permease [Myxococcales bacterium]|nr:LptF/LptG family permease [Myxococcales bacterium]